MKICVVNYITRNTWHPHGQERLKESLRRVGFKDDILLFDNENFPCTIHKKTPYAFKFHVLREAQNRGYEIALWVDASFWAIKEVDTLFKTIEEHGFVVQDSGYPLGQWISDDCLKRMDLDKEESFKLPLFAGGLMGINFSKVSKFFEEFYQLAKDGRCFQGAWRNRHKEVSNDERVLGHRHDMSVGSILMHRHNMSMFQNNTFFNYYAWYQKYKIEKDLSKVYFLIEGGPRKLPLKGIEV